MNITCAANFSHELHRDDGTTVVLTDNEWQEIRTFANVETLRRQVEFAVQTAEESNWISFENWHNVGFADYSSEDDARSDFIDKIIEDITDRDELYNRDPVHTDDEIFNDVVDTAKDFGYES